MNECIRFFNGHLLVWWIIYLYDKSFFWWVGLYRSCGLEMKSLLICMRRDLAMPDMLLLSLDGQTTAVMVCSLIPHLDLSRC